MTTQLTTDAQLHALGETWAAAEVRGDTSALGELVTDDFTLVGPLGFVLDHDQWMMRYRTGDLVTEELVWDELAIRDYGDTAVIVGRHTQKTAFRGNRVDGSFRSTHVVVRRDGRWLLAGIHLSPIGAPPAFAAGR
ncbi:nuclear transport factor 2 family protein [Fodinicola acaciae]|uniref:nuclear transport factor 2 family protein n=1 Tax=Fodinicola acaciae TaxID=2681555 RepID=UPI001C9E6424|nr:nuclear transport factor 2 family protein [Fodinicola acaciae]